MRIVVVSGSSQSLTNFRGEMLRAMASNGHRVLGLGPEDEPRVRAALGSMGVGFDTAPISRHSVNPLRDLRATVALARRFRRFRADVTLTYSPKPVIYGTLAAWLAGVPLRSAMITGVGSALGGSQVGLRRRALGWVMLALYRLALSRAHVVFFQNPDDERLFRSKRLIGEHQRVVRIRGSGVDLAHYSPVPLPTGPVVFLMISRLIRDKGTVEFVEAARAVRQGRPDVRFLLLGGEDPNPSAVPAEQVEAWRREGAVEILAPVRDIRPVIARCHVVVLPSYSEGMPRSVLEGMAMGRAILTTDAPGCRETVDPGRNGLLVPVRDAAALAEGMQALLSDAEHLGQLGRESRIMAEERFDVHEVNKVILASLGLSAASSPEGR